MSKLYIIFKSWWIGDKVSAEGFSFNWKGLITVIIVIAVISIIGTVLGKKSKKKIRHKETKADKKKWDKYGIYAAIIFLPLYVLFLIFYAD
jgi:hypothetical protein